MGSSLRPFLASPLHCILSVLSCPPLHPQLHIFPEARIIQQHGPLHASTAHLPRGAHHPGARPLAAPQVGPRQSAGPPLPLATPAILLCVGHSGLERRVSVVVGEPFSFDLPSLRQQAKDAARLDALSSDHSSSSRTDSSSSSSSSSTSSSNRSDSSTSSSSSTSMRDSDAAVSLDPTWRQQLLTFGTDALIHSPEVLTQRLQDLTQRGLLAESAGGGGRTGDGERLEGE
ncbi:hypothetical protein CLOM_g2393 [Closterium sp. NIES-68]|nr:hypothetical protein CLOM_g2393 [Closterium sp. NIES-68]